MSLHSRNVLYAFRYPEIDELFVFVSRKYEPIASPGKRLYNNDNDGVASSTRTKKEELILLAGDVAPRPASIPSSDHDHIPRHARPPPTSGVYGQQRAARSTTTQHIGIPAEATTIIHKQHQQQEDDVHGGCRITATFRPF